MIFKISYGIKGEVLKETSFDCIHLGEAMQEAHDRAIKMFLDTDEGQLLREDIYDNAPDRYSALGRVTHEALKFVDYFAEEPKKIYAEIPKASESYLVSNQVNAFDDEFNQISVEEALNLLEPLEEVALDTETTGLDVHTDKLLLLQLGDENIQIVFDISTYGGRIPREIKEYLNDPKRGYILQNAKFDLQFLFKQEILLRTVYDTMLAEIILTNGLQYSGRGLKDIVAKYCGVGMDKEVRAEFSTIGITSRGIKYASEDIKYLPAIKRLQLEQAKEVDVTRAINLDNLFVIVLAYTEYCGIKLDYDKWMGKYHKNVENILKLKDRLAQHVIDDGKAGDKQGPADLFSGAPSLDINWNSPAQVKTLFKSYGIDLTVTEKGVKKETVSADVLKDQVFVFPVLQPYIDYKKAQKDLTTYGANWDRHINRKTGRIHTSFKQLMNTGRMSCGDKRDGAPNLQNLPGDSETRSCFIAEKGNTMISADYSSQEQIVLANFSREKNLLNFYARGFTDMHSYIAFLMYPDIRRSSLEDLTPDKLEYLKKEYPKERGIAKAAGFAITSIYKLWPSLETLRLIMGRIAGNLMDNPQPIYLNSVKVR